MSRRTVDRPLRVRRAATACCFILGLAVVYGLLTTPAPVSAAQAQPTCATACRVNPITAPAGCDCTAPGGTPTPAPVSPVPQVEPVKPPAPAEPAKPTCETACRVNPVTAPRECSCETTTVPAPVADSVIIGGSGPGGGPGGAEPLLDDPVTANDILDLMLVSYEREVAKIDNYYFVETTDIVPRPTVRYFEKEVEGGRSIFKEVPLAELAKREQLADPTLSAQDRAIAERPQVLLGGLATAFDGIAKMLGVKDAAKPFTDGLRGVEAGLDAGMGSLSDSADDVGGLFGPETIALFHRRVVRASMAVMVYNSETDLMPSFHYRDDPTTSARGRAIARSLHEEYAGGYATPGSYPCYILSLPSNRVVEGIPYKLVSADMWACVLGPRVFKPVRVRVEYLTNAGDASVGELIEGGSRPVVIDQISFDHLPVGNMRPAQKVVQAISGMSDTLQTVRKLRRNFTVNKEPKQRDIVEAVGEDLGRDGPP